MDTPSPTDGVPRGLRPVVWLTAGLWLPVRYGLRGGERVLEAYDDGANAAWRALVRASRAVCRALVRVLGPVGRACKRALLPVWLRARRVYDRVGLWLLLRLLKPVGRALRRLLTSLRPVVVAARRLVAAVVDRLEPAWEAVLRGTAAVDRAVVRLGQRLQALWAPVGRAVSALAGRGRASG